MNVCGRLLCRIRGVNMGSWQTCRSDMLAEDALGSWRARLDKTRAKDLA